MVLPVTKFKGLVFDIENNTKSPSEAWRRLEQRYCESGVEV